MSERVSGIRGSEEPTVTCWQGGAPGGYTSLSCGPVLCNKYMLMAMGAPAGAGWVLSIPL